MRYVLVSKSPDKLIQAIKILPAQFEELLQILKDQDPSLMDTPIREGAWTVRQVLNHLADSHINSYVRIKLMLSEDNPHLQPYNEEVWAEMPDCKTLPVDHTLRIIQGIHARLVALLETLNEKDWTRKAEHGELGEITLLEYTQILADHGITHLQSIEPFIQ